MSDSVTTSVEVAVSPEVAFDVFTREIDAWYRVDPAALPDITRTAAIRFEPHAGGRLLDVHDLDTGEGRELGRITAWEPGRRLAFVDNEASEVEITFERSDAGTRVALTHRGLDRLSPQRAAQLRRSGWGALAPFYRDHLAPNAWPLALAVATWVVLAAIFGGVLLMLMLARVQPAVSVAVLVVVFPLAAFLAWWMEHRLVTRWVPSPWRYRRTHTRILGLASFGLLLWGLYRAVWHGDDPVAVVGFPATLLLASWSGAQAGPASGRSLRTRAGSAQKTFAERHLNVWFLSLLAGLGVLYLALYIPLSLTNLQGFFFPAVLALSAAACLYLGASKRREKKTLGFDPDFYLAVERRVSEQDRRPELLVHWPSRLPEYSGWYVYASEHDQASRDLVAWTMKDLLEQSPEAAGPLREGRGEWEWDQAQRAYRRVEHPRPT